MCAVARAAGALGAKLTGAGGGGSVVALAPSKVVGEAVLAAWRDAGFEGFAAGAARDIRGRTLENESVP
jgi:mevalonate kinase